MSITSAKSGATGISLALDNNFMEPIASTLVGAGGVNTVIFNDIPQNYKHLHLRCLVQTNRATYCRDSLPIRFNGDFSASYSSHNLYGDGTSAGSGASTSQGNGSGGTIGTNVEHSGLQFGVSVIDILDYANQNKYKTMRALSGTEMNGTTGGIGGLVEFISTGWYNFAPITSIQLQAGVGTLLRQNSRFSLYGIKG